VLFPWALLIEPKLSLVHQTTRADTGVTAGIALIGDPPVSRFKAPASCVA
jgi:hypothetical protein